MNRDYLLRSRPYLTKDGQALKQAAQTFYASCTQIKKDFQQKPSTVKLHLLLEYSQLRFWDCIFLYYATHSDNVVLERTFIDYVDLERALEFYPNSIAITYLHDELWQKLSQSYICQLIKTCYLSLCVSKTSPLAHSKSLSLKSLHHMKILFYTPKDRPSCLTFMFQKYQLEDRDNEYIYQVTPTLQNELGQRNDVICFAPETIAHTAFNSMVPIPLKERLPIHLCCIAKNATIPAELIEALQEC